MILKTTYEGIRYTWVEKGEMAALLIDGDDGLAHLVWRGYVTDPSGLTDKAPLVVLLDFSCARQKKIATG